MRNLLALVGLGIVSVVGLGWYLDWFKVKTAPAPNGHRSVNIDVNTPKIGADIKKGKEEIRDYLAKSHSDLPAPPPGFPTTVVGVPNAGTPTTGIPNNTAPLFPPVNLPDGQTVIFPPLEAPTPFDSLPKPPTN